MLLRVQEALTPANTASFPVGKTGFREYGLTAMHINMITNSMRSRFFPTLVALAAFSVLIALGVWQMERRAWKNDLIARLEAALSAPPANYNPARPAGAE